MTRAEKSPVKRVVATAYDGELVAEVGGRTLTLRPLRTKRGGKAEVAVTWGMLYNHLLMARATEQAKEKARQRKLRRLTGGR